MCITITSLNLFISQDDIILYKRGKWSDLYNTFSFFNKPYAFRNGFILLRNLSNKNSWSPQIESIISFTSVAKSVCSYEQLSTFITFE